MKPGLDVKHINPFLQSSLTVLESAAQMKMSIGKPSVSDLGFKDQVLVLQVGVTGDLKGQILLVMTVDSAKRIASGMMMGMPVAELDDMATSALSELSNMIMGNTATLFSSQDIRIDITPPLTMFGAQLHLTSDAQALKVPFMFEGCECLSIYICVAKD